MSLRKTATSFETLTQEPQRATAGESSSSFRVTIVRHPRAERLGSSAAVALPGRLTIGRKVEWLGQGALADERISRDHAVLELTTSGALFVEDCGSHNGTFVGGERVERRELREGDVIGVGRIALLVHRGPADHIVPESRGPWVEASAAMTAAMRDVARWSRGSECIAIIGERGSGRSALARRIHDLSGRTGALVIVAPAALGDELVLPTLYGNAEGAYAGATRDRAGLLEEADGGTLVVDGIDAARPAFAAALSAFLDRGEVVPVGGGAARAVDVRVIAIAETAPHAGAQAGVVAPALAARFGLAVLRIPPLRERKEDIPLLMALTPNGAGRPMGDSTPDVEDALVRGLLAYDWPGNVRELLTLVASARREADGGPLVLTPPLAATLGAQCQLAREAHHAGRVAVARNGAFFITADGRRVELATRRALVRILARLVEAAAATDAPRLDVEALFAAGWPGERAAASAASTRVYVALATLRRQGLREVVARDGDGYFLIGDALDVVLA